MKFVRFSLTVQVTLTAAEWEGRSSNEQHFLLRLSLAQQVCRGAVLVFTNEDWDKARHFFPELAEQATPCRPIS